MLRYIKKEDTKAGMIYDKKDMRYINDDEVVDILNNKEETIAEMVDVGKVYTESEVLDIVDRCFHCYASDFRNDAQEWAQEIMND